MKTIIKHHKIKPEILLNLEYYKVGSHYYRCNGNAQLKQTMYVTTPFNCNIHEVFKT